MIKRKRKAFTIVELVIVIAVIAILAAVLIPTFASIINKANESADIQAVRQMNMALLVESAEKKPEGIKRVIEILDAAGYNAKEKLIPVSKGHSFYWYKTYNLIVLVKDADGSDAAELIFPVEDEAMVTAFNDLKSSWDAATGGDTQVLFDLKEGEEYLSVNTVNANASNLSEINAAIAGALEEGKSNVVININSDITVSEALTIGENLTVTINLNDKTLMIGSDTEPEQSSAKAFYSPSASLDASGAAAVAEEPSDPSISVSGTLNINGGTILTRAGYDGETPLGLVVNSTGTLNLNNMTVTVGTGAKHALYNYGGTVTATDCIFNEAAGATITYEYLAPIFNRGGIIEMKSVEIYSSNYCTAVYYRVIVINGSLYADYGKITIDKNSFLNLTVEKNVAPCGDYNAYNVYYDDYYDVWLPTDNTNAGECFGVPDFFEYSGNSRDTDGFYFKTLKPILSTGGSISLTEDLKITCPVNVATDKIVTVDLGGHALTVDYTGNFGGGMLKLTGTGTINTPFTSFASSFAGQFSIEGSSPNSITVNLGAYNGDNGYTNDYALPAALNAFGSKNCSFINSEQGEHVYCNEEGIVCMESNINIQSLITVPANKTVTLDLNGYTINSYEPTIDKLLVPSGARLNIVDNQGSGSIKELLFDVESGGNIHLDGVTLKIAESDAKTLISHILTVGNITVKDVTIKHKFYTDSIKLSTNGEELTIDIISFSGNCKLNDYFDNIPAGKTVTINLNNNTTIDVAYSFYSLNVAGTLKFTGEGTVTNWSCLKIQAGGKVEREETITIQ